MHLLLKILVTWVIVIFATNAHAQQSAMARRSVVVIGGDHRYPPYEFIDREGNPSGFNVALTRAIAEVMGLTVEIRLGEWDEMRHALQNGTVDVLQGVVHSPAREQYLDFTPPYCIVNYSLFGRQGALPINAIWELRGKEVIVQKGSIMHDYLLESQVGAVLILVDTHVEAMRILASGKHDYALVGNLPGLYLSRELGLTNVVALGKLFAGQAYGYAFNKGNAELVAQFSEGLAILKNTGRYQKIYDQWLGALEPQMLPWTKILLYGSAVVVPLLVLLGGSLIWNWSLQKEVVVHTDELQLRQQQLIQADKMASLGILVSGVAHEVNNPTGLILFNLPVLKKAYQVAEVSLEERFREEGDYMIGGLRYSQLRQEIPCMFDEMLESARRIKRIVEDLKNFARKDCSPLTESVDLNQVARAALRLLDNSIKKATTKFQSEFADDIPSFRGNFQRIEQVVVNLVLNACQALPNPERGMMVTTLYRKDRGELVLTIKDEGTGIPKEHLPHITDPFFTTKREQGGTGLGLSISAGIIKEHGGRLEVESVEGIGTTVTMWLPAEKRM